MNAKVGADVESLCRKCGDVWHVIVAMVGGQIAKVQCKQCHGYHRYRPLKASERGTVGPSKRRGEEGEASRPAANPAPAPKPGHGGAPMTFVAAPATTERTRSREAKPRARAPSANAPMVAADTSKPSRPYRPRDVFEIGERVEHPTFGLGVVEEVPAPGKMNVFFPIGRKLLMCGNASRSSPAA